MELFRATIFHTPDNPFSARRWQRWHYHKDGGLLVDNGRVLACGDYEAIRRHIHRRRRDGLARWIHPARIRRHPRSLPPGPHHRRDGPVAARLARGVALPEEARMADTSYAAETRQLFLARARIARHDNGAGVWCALSGRDGRILRRRRRVWFANRVRARVVGSPASPRAPSHS